MSKDGLSRLTVSLMVSGGVTAIDAAQPADAHAALLHAVRLPGGEMLPHVFGTEVHAVPDPSVGLRVLGLTQALWEAVSRRWLEPCGFGGRALLVLSDAAARDLARRVSEEVLDGRSYRAWSPRGGKRWGTVGSPEGTHGSGNPWSIPGCSDAPSTV